MEEFVSPQSENLLDLCGKEQYYDIDICDKPLKDMVKAILKGNLFEKRVLFEEPPSATGAVLPPSFPGDGFVL